MKTPRIANAVGHIDDDLIAAAAEKKIKHNPWIKWGPIAACLAVFVLAGAIVLPSVLGGNVTPGETENGRYKDFNIQAQESAIIWPWEYRTVYEKYTELTIDGIEYRGKGRSVSEILVDELIGTNTVIGYDEITNEKHTGDFEVYQLKYADKSQFVAVKMDGIFYVFKNDQYAPPGTLGELLESVDLSRAIKLSRFSENGDSPSENHFILNGDDFIWEVLADCKDAEFVEDQQWSVSDSNYYLSFTITSDALGIYKKAMYITKEGYLWTNAFDWQYVFNIGKDAAEKIIQYAKENSEKAAYEPFNNSITGKVIEITDDEILVDDSILCKNPADGITYKVLLTDLRISRYVDHGVVAVGDTVRIAYEGDIDIEHVHTIDTAYNVSKVVISGGNVLIPE